MLARYLIRGRCPAMEHEKWGIYLERIFSFISYFDGEKSQFVVSKYHGKEEVFVDSVRLCGDFSTKTPRKACVMVRIQVSIFCSISE